MIVNASKDLFQLRSKNMQREVERIENVFEKEKDEYVKLENE